VRRVNTEVLQSALGASRPGGRRFGEGSYRVYPELTSHGCLLREAVESEGHPGRNGDRCYVRHSHKCGDRASCLLHRTSLLVPGDSSAFRDPLRSPKDAGGREGRRAGRVKVDFGVGTAPAFKGGCSSTCRLNLNSYNKTMSG
jgi:hypothetical protein